MPELPEVETVRRGLLPSMEGQTIISADIRRPDLRWPFPDRFAERLTGATVKSLGRRSKYILADLNTDETLIVHLGMSGRIMISGDPQGVFHQNHAAPEKHDHVILDMSNGARITFNDPRRFGAMGLAATSKIEKHRLLANIGPEPLGNDFHEDYLVTKLKGKNTPIKSALLDQKVVAGLGNIYVCEVLFRAGISPFRRAARISRARTASLVPLIRTVLNEAIAAGGSSLKDYRHVDGELGYFQHTFAVYDREGQSCFKCSGKVSRTVQSGRSSFYCAQCQR